jgi:hypothetical protein
VRLYLHASIIDRSQSDISATTDMTTTVLDAIDLVKLKKHLEKEILVPRGSCKTPSGVFASAVFRIQETGVRMR